ncbi:MAG: methyltransferase domain-containing protein [Acidobacteria bacterium]|nr:methyltransferase domain-containing protein [Acidobacteriota bacterium]
MLPLAFRFCLTLLVGGVVFGQQIGTHQNLAPFVPSPQPVVERMLEAARVKPGETVYDLGCGDGRIVITAAQKFSANGVGVELSPRLVKEAINRIRQLGLESSVQIVQGDLLEVDISGADVVTLYLETLSNDKLRPKLEKSLKPGARVVSYEFKVRGWTPLRVEKVFAYNREHNIYVYSIGVRK